MTRILAIAKKNIVQLTHQKGALLTTFVAPVATFFLFSLVFSTKNSSELSIEALNPPPSLEQALKDQDSFALNINKDKESMISNLAQNKNSIGLSFENDKPTIYVGGVSFSQNHKNLKMVGSILSLIKNPGLGATPKKPKDIVYLHNIKDFTMFETMAPGMISVMVMFFVFVITGMAFLEEKSSGTLERVFITPLKTRELVLGYIISFGLIAMVQVGIFQFFYYYVFKLRVNGSFFQATLVSAVTAFVALTFGMLVSSFAKTQFQVMQTIPIFLAPQMVLSGIFDISSSNMAVKIASKAMPMTHSVAAMQKILLENKSILDAGLEIGVLFGFIAVFMAGTYVFLGRYKPGFWIRRNKKT